MALGSPVPDVLLETTCGDFQLHDILDCKWSILILQPEPHHSVATTVGATVPRKTSFSYDFHSPQELGMLAKLYRDVLARNASALVVCPFSGVHGDLHRIASLFRVSAPQWMSLKLGKPM